MFLPGILLASQLIATVANQPPVFDLKPTCSGLGDIVETQRACEDDEKAAHQELAKQWDQFAGPDRTMCTDLTKGFEPSYVELLSCLEMMRDAKVPSNAQK